MTQVPVITTSKKQLQNTVRKQQDGLTLEGRARAILARPNARTPMGMLNPSVVNKEEAGIIAEYKALSSPGFAAQRGPVAPPTPFQARKALTGPQGLLNMAKGMGVGALEAAEIWREEVGLPTVGAASWALSPSVREQYDIARAKGEDPRKAMATAWQKGLTDTPWGAKGLAELIVDPINLVPVLGFPGAIAKGFLLTGAGARLGAKTLAAGGREIAEGVAQLPVPSALRPQRAYTMPPEGDPGGIGARRTEEIRKQAEQARQAGQQPSWLTDPMQTEAIRNTAGAEITAEGILLKAVRFQKPEQSGMFSIRSGVFYLPEVKSPYQRYYSTGKVGYGGKQKIERTIEVKNPIILKGASGGKVPERAYDMVMGKKGSYQAMRADVLKATSRLSRSASDDILNAVADVLAKYGGDEGMASEIIRFSKEGNQLPYAVQENIVANVVRNAGYDAILGYNKVGGRNRLSEVFALSETHYPDPMDVMPSPVARQAADARMTFGMGTPASRLADAADPSVARLDTFLTKGVVSISTESKATIKAIQQSQNKPNTRVRIYRAVPEGVTSIDPGDWVALDRAYASMHLRNPSDKIISQIVDAKDVAWARTSDDEWLFAPTRQATDARIVVPDDPKRYGISPNDPEYPMLRQPSGAPVRGTPISPDDARIPDVVYHVTTNSTAVRSTGLLRASGEGGLGGDELDAMVSFTTDRGIANQIADDFRLASEIAKMPKDSLAIGERLLRQATEEGWGDWQGFRRLVALAREGKHERIAKDWLTDYFGQRMGATQKRNPLLLGDAEKFKGWNPANIEVMPVPKSSLRTGAMVTDFDLGSSAGLKEIRIYGDVSVSPLQRQAAGEAAESAKLAARLPAEVAFQTEDGYTFFHHADGTVNQSPMNIADEVDMNWTSKEEFLKDMKRGRIGVIGAMIRTSSGEVQPTSWRQIIPTTDTEAMEAFWRRVGEPENADKLARERISAEVADAFFESDFLDYNQWATRSTKEVAEEALEEVPPLRTGKTRPEDTGEGYAINIKLGKYSKETQNIIDSVAARHTEALVNAKRDVRSTADTLADARKLIDEVGGDADKVIRDWKPGQAWNAETITALRLGLQDKARAVEELAYRVQDPNKATNEDIARFRILMGELVSLQHVVTGVTSEVARATQSLSIKIADITDVGGFATSPKALRDLIDQTRGMDDIPAIAREFLSRVEAGDTFQAQKLLNDALKPTWFDYITELWINSLLSSPKTLFVNSISNMANTIMSPVERATAAGVESILAPLSGRARERFFAEVPADAYGAYAGLIDGVKAWLKVVREGINPAEATKYDFSQKAFKGKLGRLIRAPGTFLEAADAGHSAINERAAMEALVIRMVRKEGLKGDERVARMAELKLNPTKGMLREVRDTAQYRLFRNELTGWVGDLQKYRNKHPWIRLIIPFLRTPANLVTYGLVRSPLGVFNKNMWRNIAEKNPEASDEIARVFLGTAVGGGLVAVLKDRITGRPPTNPADRDRFYREGKLPYAIKVGDTWIQYQRLEPFNQVLAQVAAYHQYMDEVEEGEEFDINTMVGNISATIVQNLMSQAYLSGMSDLFMLFTEPDRYTQSYVSRLAAGFIPASSLLRTIAQMQDRTIRRPRGGTLGIGEGLQAGLPTIDTPFGTFGAGTTQPVVTAMGEDVQRPGSPWFPITYSTEDMSRLDTELNRLNIRVGLASRVLAGENLTPDQYTQYQRLVGRLVQEHLQEAINQPNYQGLPDARKESALERAIADAREKGRDEMVAILEGGASEIAPGVPVTPGASILDRF